MNAATSSSTHGLQGRALYALVTLRMLVGWHFLYEGIAKLTTPGWTAAGYLQASEGWFSGFFGALALSPGAMAWVDPLNAWGLMAIGLALVVGVFERPAALAGMVLLGLYYLAAPPFPGLEYAIPAEGSYLIVNKVLIEAAALWAVYTLPTSRAVGLARLAAFQKGGLGREPDAALAAGGGR